MTITYRFIISGAGSIWEIFSPYYTLGLLTRNQGIAGSISAGPTKNQEVTTSKVAAFFYVSSDADWQSQSDQDADR